MKSTIKNGAKSPNHKVAAGAKLAGQAQAVIEAAANGSLAAGQAAQIVTAISTLIFPYFIAPQITMTAPMSMMRPLCTHKTEQISAYSHHSCGQ